MNRSYNDFFNAAKQAKSGPKKSIKKKSSPKLSSRKQPNIKSKSRKKSPNFPVIPGLIFIICFLLTGWGYLNLDEVMTFIGRIEVSPVQKIVAAEKKAEKNTTDKSTKEENHADSTEGEQAKTKEKTAAEYGEDVKYFSKLSNRKRELDQRESELNELESELHEQRKEVEVRILKLEKIRAQIGQVLRDKVEVDEERVKKLVEFYSNMKPQSASKIISRLNEDLAVEILGKMKKKNAAAILNLLKPLKAQVLTEKFAGYKRR